MVPVQRNNELVFCRPYDKLAHVDDDVPTTGLGEFGFNLPMALCDEFEQVCRPGVRRGAVGDCRAAAGYAALVTGDPRELPRLIATKEPHLVLLDLMLPETDGIELMQSLPELADLPVIFISGCRRNETIARALEIGAADYIVKPFSPTELTARAQAALRRRAGPEPFALGELAIDYEGRRVTLAGRSVSLTVTEYELLRVPNVLSTADRATFDDFLGAARMDPNTEGAVSLIFLELTESPSFFILSTFHADQLRGASLYGRRGVDHGHTVHAAGGDRILNPSGTLSPGIDLAKRHITPSPCRAIRRPTWAAAARRQLESGHRRWCPARARRGSA